MNWRRPQYDVTDVWCSRAQRMILRQLGVARTPRRVHSVFGFLVPSSLFHAMYDMYLCYVCYVYAYACHVGSLCAIRMYVYVCAHADNYGLWMHALMH